MSPLTRRLTRAALPLGLAGAVLTGAVSPSPANAASGAVLVQLGPFKITNFRNGSGKSCKDTTFSPSSFTLKTGEKRAPARRWTCGELDIRLQNWVTASNDSFDGGTMPASVTIEWKAVMWRGDTPCGSTRFDPYVRNTISNPSDHLWFNHKSVTLHASQDNYSWCKNFSPTISWDEGLQNLF